MRSASFSEAAKYAHNFVSFAFTIGLILIVVMWIRDNIPSKVDIEWLKQGGGFIKSKHAPAGRFNAGEKLVFWFALGAGAAVIASGFVLLFPFYLTNIAGMQIAQVVHAVVAVLFVAVDPRPHLYRHARNGGGVRGHGDRRRRPQLGEGASRPMAPGRARQAARGRRARRAFSDAGRVKFAALAMAVALSSERACFE